ncbi:hypothetical protein D3C76_769570 [compost metagenome]
MVGAGESSGRGCLPLLWDAPGMFSSNGCGGGSSRRGQKKARWGRARELLSHVGIAEVSNIGCEKDVNKGQ